MITNDTLREQKRAERKLRRQLGEVGGELSQFWRVLAPWLLLAAALVLAPLAWLFAWLGEVQIFTAICIALAGLVMLVVSIKLTRGRMTLGRVHELFNFAAPTGVISYTVAFGPDKYVLIGAAVFGVASAIIWNRRHTSTAMRELERVSNGSGATGRVPAAWREFAREHMPQAVGTNVTVFSDTPEMLQAGLDLGEGVVPSELTGEHAVEKITRFFGGIRGGTALHIGERLDKIGITVMRTDPLKKPHPWAGVLDPGESIREPIRGLGKYRDLADLTLHLPYVPNYKGEGEDKPQSHMIFAGMSRSGKGEAGEQVDVNVATRKDSAVVICDAVKADQQLGEIGDGAVYVLDNVNSIRAYFNKIVNATIPARAAWLGNPNRNPLGKAMKEWEPGCGLTWLLIHVYEAPALFNNQDMTKITERAASVGIELLIEAQKAIHDRVDTNARSNAADLIMFGCKEPDDADLVLDPELMEGGAAPWIWKNKRGGMCYTVLSHLEPARMLLPARFGRKSPGDITAALNEYLHFADPLDPITAATWGEPYERFAAARAAEQDRRPRQHSFAPGGPGARPVLRGAVLLDERPPAAAAAPAPAAAPAAVDEPDGELDVDTGFDLGDPHDDEVPPDDEAVNTELTQVAETVVGDMAIALDGDAEAGQVLNQAVDALERYGEDDELNPDGGMLPGRDMDFPEDPDEAHLQPIVSRDEALDIVLDILAEDIGEGGTFRWADLYDRIRARTRRGDSWVRKLRRPLLDWGCVQEADAYGLYVVIHTRRGDLADYPESPGEELCREL